MIANLENSAWPQDWKRSVFIPIPKKRFAKECLILFVQKNCTHFTCQQGNVQNPSRQASPVSEPRISRCTSWIQKRQRNQRSNCQQPLDHRRSKGIPEKHRLLLSLTTLKPLTVSITTVDSSPLHHLAKHSHAKQKQKKLFLIFILFKNPRYFQTFLNQPSVSLKSYPNNS